MLQDWKLELISATANSTRPWTFTQYFGHWPHMINIVVHLKELNDLIYIYKKLKNKKLWLCVCLCIKFHKQKRFIYIATKSLRIDTCINQSVIHVFVFIVRISVCLLITNDNIFVSQYRRTLSENELYESMTRLKYSNCFSWFAKVKMRYN